MAAQAIVAPTNLGVAGTRVASVRAGYDRGLTLWRVSQPTRISYRVTGIPADEWTAKRVTVEVFGCDGGALETTIFGRKPGTMVEVSVDSTAKTVRRIFPLRGLTTRISLPRLTGLRQMCFVKFDPRGRIRLGEIRRVAQPGHALRLAPVSAVKVVSPNPGRVGYCISGRFVDLFFRQPEFDSSFHDATLANYIQGRGLVCDDPPDGYARKGLAPSNLGVTGDVYPYYVPTRTDQTSR